MNQSRNNTLWHSAFAGPAAFALYSILSIALTWPVTAGIAHDVPGDLGDSLLNMWILAWGAEHIPRLLTFQMSWADFWNANIFHPEPLSLALSEHLFGQSLQILPIYWLTGNIILCYNLLFISTFALSAFGTYLLVRDLTGDRRAAFIAGLVYGFLPYRIASIPHVQVMSSQWMPFALYGLNRFVTRLSASGSQLSAFGSRFPVPGSQLQDYAPLAFGTGALVLQNWSCGYYLLYFAPFLPVFLLHRMWTLGTLRSARTWIGLSVAAVATLMLSLPFLFPYRQAAATFGFQRPFGEVVLFSANAWSYITASENLRLFGKALRFYPHGEGETFLGFTPWLLAAVAMFGLLRNGTRSHQPSAHQPLFIRIATWLLTFLVITQLLAVLSVFLFGGFEIGPISARTPQRLVLQLIIAFALLLGISARARSESIRIFRSPIFFATAATLLAVWLSLGPIPKAGDSLVSGLGLYKVLYDYVPGFNGVRVPARYAMVAGLFLAIAAGFGGARVLGGTKSVSTKREQISGARSRTALLVTLATILLMEGAAIPLQMNHTWNQNEAMPPARVMTYSNAPAVYQRVAALPAGTAITEFPFGDAAWEIRYVYYAAAHWKPITNGYSGNFPPSYTARVARLQRVSRDPEAAWQSLKDSGSTHAIVHRNAFAKTTDADTIETWLRAHGATDVERFADGDVLLQLPR